ncbi:aldehyde ferredoxin oxidoreductase N-terminal domain-containing protein [Desulfitobacterium sp.]|uniref:aldehyde ferredoxin oxidoreductase N-terminal domain-containing protein n=1 Tax=Desulfitobacterium sp. TaxID=49981 RepID=UPI002B213E68|nr:aldehyde ferredoxin oxidoreductase N-terminal domain-containing protein [Desulfitobacterium sp.]MEA4901579.1 aldehyde ferredoxin oxidoreductase N-terminal domain-containing protein [Desulfitobacterium sp.]
MFGWTGKLIVIDLSKGECHKETLLEDYYYQWIGGQGLNIAVQAGKLPGWERLAGDIVSIAAGPLVGSPVMGENVWSLDGLHPFNGQLTSVYGTGNWGAVLKFTGWDQVILWKTARKPCYIILYENGCDIKEYQENQGTAAFFKIMKRNFGDEAEALVSTDTGIVTSSGLVSADSEARFLLERRNVKAVIVQGKKGLPLAKPKDVLAQSSQIVKRWKETGLSNGSNGCAVCHGHCERLMLSRESTVQNAALNLWLATGSCPQWISSGLGQSVEELCSLLECVTGWSCTPVELWAGAHRIEEAKQMINERIRRPILS